MVFCTFRHKSVNFPGNFIIVYQQNSKNHVFLHIFQTALSQKFKIIENAWFFALFGTKVLISQGILSHSLSARLKKPWVFAYFPKSRSNRNNSLPLFLFDWTALSQKFKIIENAWFFAFFGTKVSISQGILS